MKTTEVSPTKTYSNEKAFHKSKEHNITYENDLFFLDIQYIIYDADKRNYTYTQSKLGKHYNYEVQYVLNGKSEYEFADNKFVKLNKGQFLVIPPETYHRIVYEANDFKKFMFSYSLKPKETENTNFYQIAETAVYNNIKAHKDNKDIRNLVDKIIRTFNEKPPEYMNMIFFLTTSLIIEFLQIIAGNNEFEPSHKFNDIRINNAIKFIEENITENITVSDVAKHIHLSPKQLTRIFESALFVSPGSYIKNYKAKYIRNLLMDINLSLSDISEMMGYNDVSAMIRFYKNATGDTPYNFRRAFIKK